MAVDLNFSGEFKKIFNYYLGTKNAEPQFDQTVDFIRTHLNTCNGKRYRIRTPTLVEGGVTYSKSGNVVKVDSPSKLSACVTVAIYFEHINLGHLKAAYSIVDEVSSYYQGNYDEGMILSTMDLSLDKWLSTRPKQGINFSRNLFNSGNKSLDVVEFMISNSLGKMTKMSQVQPNVFNPPLVKPSLPPEVFRNPDELLITCTILCRKHINMKTNPAVSYVVNQKIRYFREFEDFLSKWVSAREPQFKYGCVYSGMLSCVFSNETPVRTFDDYVMYMVRSADTLKPYLESIFNQSLSISTKEVLLLAKRNKTFNPLTSNKYLNLVMDDSTMVNTKPFAPNVTEEEVGIVLEKMFEIFPRFCTPDEIKDDSIIFLCNLYLYALYSTSYPTKEVRNDVLIEGFNGLQVMFRFSDYNEELRRELAGRIPNLGNRNIIRVVLGYFSDYAFRFFKKHNMALRLFEGLKVPDYMRYDYIKYVNRSSLDRYENECLARICYEINRST